MLASVPKWQRLVTLVPVFVVAAGLLIGVFAVLGRALFQNIRESAHPRVFYVGFVALVGVVAVLTYLGVELPRE